MAETFGIKCEKDGCSAWDRGNVAYNLTVENLTSPELLRKLLLKIETHYVEIGDCVDGGLLKGD